ncbi:hypothetical protein GCM10010149_50230 [Nonomuraea roseoviolacea subsp. roseoviolacea]|uniref:B12-binding domain-containing radical SAM protein n=1 Tax=Nonomuraea roseoviolacea TaxID=103837 RepID=UPI0031D3C26C
MATLDLVFPPLTGANYPYLSTAVLKAYVRQESRHKVGQADLNLRYIRHLLTPEAVRERVAAAETTARALERRSLTGREAFHLQHCLDVAGRGPAVADLLPAALRAVRSAAAVNDATEMAVADTVIAEALSAATVDRPPDQLNLVDPVFAASAADPRELRAALARDDCPFMAAYDRLVAPGELLADVVGISVVYRGQVYPALALARWLRLRRPEARILLGGPFFTSHRDRLRHHPWPFDLVDAFVVYEGERPLVSYLDHLDTGEPLDGIPGLIFRRDGHVRQTGMPRPVAAKDLPTPDFDGLPLRDYLMPAPVLPLLASRGCYWNCAFCTHHHIYGDSYRVRPVELIGRDLATLAERHGCRHVYFVDESMSPKLLRHISRAITQSGADLRWGCETRMERSLTRDDFRLAHESGCRVLSFGMESANQRVLDLMNKGISVATIERVIGDCAEVGIKAHVMCIIGFPGETEEEAQETIDFTAAHRSRIDLLDFSVFCLNRHSPIERSPDTFGVTAIRELVPGHDFEERLAYEAKAGLDRSRAYDVWERAVASEHFAAIRSRCGHAQRERFLFGDDPPAAAGTGELREAVTLRPARALPVWHDVARLREHSRAFAARRGRALSVDGVAFSESWRLLDAVRRLRPRDSAGYLVFRPSSWTDVELPGPLVSLAASLAADRSPAAVAKQLDALLLPGSGRALPGPGRAAEEGGRPVC